MTRRRPTRAIALLTLWLVAAVGAAAAERVGTVAELTGRAEVQRAGDPAWVPVAVGDEVRQGDQLRTLADGRLRVVLREDSSLTLAPGSQLVITEQVLVPAPVSRFQLLLGVIKAAVTERYAEPQARFEVETPTAIAGVRGTSFIAEYDPALEETLVLGVEDVTRVRARVDPAGRGEVNVLPGQATRVRRGSRPAVPEALSNNRSRRLRNLTTMGSRAGGAGGGSRKRENRRDAQRPQRSGQRAFPIEERAIDQPAPQRGPKPPPPPPPVPSGGR